jgi:hypothetical protein
MKSESVKLQVNGEEKEYSFNSLSWADYPKLMGVVSKLNFKKGEENNFLEQLDEATVTKLMDLELKMFQKSYPNLKENDIKEIIIENVFALLEPLITVNIGK